MFIFCSKNCCVFWWFCVAGSGFGCLFVERHVWLFCLKNLPSFCCVCFAQRSFGCYFVIGNFDVHNVLGWVCDLLFRFNDFSSLSWLVSGVLLFC